MSRLKMLLSVFAVSAFLPLVVGISQAHAGAPPPTTCDGQNCTILCYNQPGGVCDGDEGTDGNDVFCGSENNDIENGGRGCDILCGYGGADQLHGGFGCDSLFGDNGNSDILQGGHCEDYFDGGYGTGDICLGGWGFDVFTVTGSCEIADQGKEDDHPTQGECGCC